MNEGHVDEIFLLEVSEQTSRLWNELNQWPPHDLARVGRYHGVELHVNSLVALLADEDEPFQEFIRHFVAEDQRAHANGELAHLPFLQISSSFSTWHFLNAYRVVH